MKKIKKILICLSIISIFGVVTPNVMAEEIQNGSGNVGVFDNENDVIDDNSIL